MRKKTNPYRILVGKPEGKNHVQDQGEDGIDTQIAPKCELFARTGYILASLVILKRNACSIRVSKISHFKLLIYAFYSPTVLTNTAAMKMFETSDNPQISL
jgi:hypothetical protein